MSPVGSESVLVDSFQHTGFTFVRVCCLMGLECLYFTVTALLVSASFNLVYWNWQHYMLVRLFCGFAKQSKQTFQT